ncbi:MAG: nucleoside deaminase [Planctomycetes bacterium]|nr:nucleoside deaminase [Planctomycetota bacterium]
MTITSEERRRWLARCLELAQGAAERGEVPVGAVVVAGGVVLGEAANSCEERSDPTAHAELLALQAACRATGQGRLPDAVLYCSLEPCFMCAGAALHARVAAIVFSTWDPKFGACGSLAMLPADPRLNHRCPVHAGELADESAALLRRFFRRLR